MPDYRRNRVAGGTYFDPVGPVVGRLLRLLQGKKGRKSVDAEREKRIIDAVKNLNRSYKNNTDYRIAESEGFGEVTIHTVAFIGENKVPYVNYVREYRESLKPWTDIKDTLSDLDRYFLWRPFLFRNFQTISIIAIAIIIVIAASIVYSYKGTFPEPLLAAVSACIGYLAGRMPKE